MLLLGTSWIDEHITETRADDKNAVNYILRWPEWKIDPKAFCVNNKRYLFCVSRYICWTNINFLKEYANLSKHFTLWTDIYTHKVSVLKNNIPPLISKAVRKNASEIICTYVCIFYTTDIGWKHGVTTTCWQLRGKIICSQRLNYVF